MKNANPHHINVHHSGKTLFWAGSDKQDTWLENMKRPSIAEYLKSQGWDNEHAIEYTYNSHGFRDQEFDERTNCLAVGCSFTEGIGLAKHQTWPTKLSEMIGIHVWNLGIGGAAADTCYRMVEYYLTILRPQTVFFLIPPPYRVELYVENYPTCHLVTDTNLPHMVKAWFADDLNSAVNHTKNLLAIRQLCNDAGVRLLVKNSATDMGSDTRARDMMHHNEDAHDRLTKLFYEEYINGTT